MAVDMITMPLVLKMPVGKGCGTIKVTGEISVPDIKPDITRVLMSDYKIGRLNVNAENGKSTISGEVELQFVYACSGDERPVRGFKHGMSFNADIDIPNLKEGMKCEGDCKVKVFDVKPVTPRKIHASIELQCCVRGYDCSEKVLIKDVIGEENVQTLKEEKELKGYMGCVTESAHLEEMYELPAGREAVWEILYSKIMLGDVRIKQSSGFAEVEGEAGIIVLYSSDTDEYETETIEFSLPYSAAIRLDEMPEAEELRVKAEMDTSQIQAVDDESGRLRLLSVNASVYVSVEGYSNIHEELVVDAFSPDYDMTVNSGMLCDEKITSQANGTFTVSKTIKTEEPLPAIKNIVITTARIKNNSVEMKSGKSVLTGTADARLIYDAEDGSGLRGIAVDIPFESEINLNDPDSCINNDVTLNILRTNCNIMNNREGEIRLDIDYKIQQMCTCEQAVNSNLKIGSPKENPYKDDVIVYMSKPGDSVWKIAKSFAVKTSDILDMEGSEICGDLPAGKKLFVL